MRSSAAFSPFGLPKRLHVLGPRSDRRPWPLEVEHRLPALPALTSSVPPSQSSRAADHPQSISTSKASQAVHPRVSCQLIHSLVMYWRC